MDANNLLQALQYSVGKTQEELRMAEEFLFQAKTMEGYIPNLILIACNRQVADPVRLSAVIHLKQLVKESWAKNSDPNKVISEKDKATLRDSVLDAIINCVDNPKIHRQLEQIILIVADCDFPQTWKNILPDVIAKLKGSDKFAEIFGSLLVLKNLVANYTFTSGQDREPLEILVTNTFPLLDVYAKNLLSNYTQEAAMAVHAILKTVHASVESELPKYFYNEKVLEAWMTYLKLIIDKPLDTNLTSPTEDQNVMRQRDSNVFWLNKKNAGRILVKLVGKFVTRRPKKGDEAVISQLFVDNYSVPFLQSFVETLFKKKEEYVPVKVQFFAMKYIFRSLNNQGLTKLLLNHLESIMFDILIPSMFLTVDDDEDWRSNPIEFIRKEDDVLERSNNLKSVARDYFVTICAEDFFAPDGELYLIKFMSYAAHILNHSTDPRTNQQTDLRMKEAILNIIGVLKDPISKNEYLTKNMESLLQGYVFPEFKNTVGFLRYRACQLTGLFGRLDYQNTENIRVAVEGLYHCLLDNDFPVRVNAGIALNHLLYQPVAIEVLKPGLSKILETYVTLIDLIDNDDLVNALEGIIDKYENDIHPYAVDLIKHLTKTFFKAHNDENDQEDSEDEEEQGEKAFAATEYLSAIARIIKCDLPKETIAALEEIVIPIIQFTLTEEGMDYIDMGLDILVGILSSSEVISQNMWQFYPELNYIVAGKPEELIRTTFSHLSEEKQALIREQATGWAYESCDSIVPCFQNYIQKGRNVIFTARDPYFNVTYLELVFKSIDRIYDLHYQRQGQVEAVIMSVLYICLLENYPKQVDDLIPYILDKVVAHLSAINNNTDNDVRKILLEIAAMCFWYDAQLTFQYLEGKGTLQFIIQNWIELLPEFNNDYELQRLMLGLASMLRVSVGNLPGMVRDALPRLLKEMISLSSRILKIREKDDYEEEAEEDEEEKKTLQKLKRINQKEDGTNEAQNEDDDEDDEDFDDFENFQPTIKNSYTSPIEDICEIIYMKESLTIFQQTQGEAYEQLINFLSNEERAALQMNIEEAEKQQAEFNRYLQEENMKKQMNGFNGVAQN